MILRAIGVLAWFALGVACHSVDPQERVEPRSAPGAGQEFLARMAGDFAVDKAFYSSNGEAHRSSGTCRQHMVHGGRFLQSDFVFKGAEGETTGTGLIGFDAKAGLFSSVWIDARSTRMSLRQSRSAFDGATIELFGAALPGDQNPRASRTETRIEAGGGVVHRQWAPNEGGGERLVMELVLTRR